MRGDVSNRGSEWICTGGGVGVLAIVPYRWRLALICTKIANIGANALYQFANRISHTSGRHTFHIG